MEWILEWFVQLDHPRADLFAWQAHYTPPNMAALRPTWSLQDGGKYSKYHPPPAITIPDAEQHCITVVLFNHQFQIRFL